MTTDTYTKVVLTVIAACLTWNALGGPALLPTAHAQGRGGSEVWIAGWVGGGQHKALDADPLPIRPK